MSLAKAKDLKRRSAEAFEAAQALARDDDGATIELDSEGEEQYRAHMDEHNDLWQRAEQLEEREAELAEASNRVGRREAIAREASQAGFREGPGGNLGAGGMREVTEEFEERQEEYGEAFERYLRFEDHAGDDEVLAQGPPVLAQGNIIGQRLLVDPMAVQKLLKEGRAGIQSTVAAQGGNLIPQDFGDEIITAQKAFGGMRRTRARIVRTNSGAAMPWPTGDDTGNEASYVNEGSTISGTTGLTFGSVTLNAHVIQSGPILASVEIIQDSAFDIAELIRDACARRIGRRSERAFFSSTSSTGTPLGLKGVSTGAVSISMAAFTGTAGADILEDLKHAVDPAYREAGGEFMFSDDTMLRISKLRGSDGDKLIQLGLENRQPRTLLGHPFVINQEVDDFAATAGNKPIWFGDFRTAYAIRDVRAMELVRFNERFMQNRRIGWLMFARHDAKPTTPTTDPAVKPVRCLVTTT